METNQEEEQHQTTETFKSPTRIIKEWAPICEEELKPKEGLEFDNLDECERFYKNYAHHAGFSVRKSSRKKNKEGAEKYKYFVCSKEGFKRTSVKVNSNRKVKLTREGCDAMVGFKRTKEGTYVLYKFYEGYTHLLATPTKRHLLKSSRHVNSVHRCLFKSLSRANIGPAKAHRISKEQAGGFEHVGCSKLDLKNFSKRSKSFY